MIKVFEQMLCMYLKTISPDVPRFTFEPSLGSPLSSTLYIVVLLPVAVTTSHGISTSVIDIC
jgi:hypothetical protein